MIINPSERLSYALMNADDAELLWQLDQDIEVMRYINGGKITTREYQRDVLLPRMAEYRNEQQGWGIWKVTIIETNQFIGWVLLRPVNFFSDEVEYDNLEIGWRFMRESWGQGYATEAAESMKQAIIAQGEAKKISAIAIEENTASTNIMTKLGLRFVKKAMHKDPLGDNELVFYEMDVGE